MGELNVPGRLSKLLQEGPAESPCLDQKVAFPRFSVSGLSGRLAVLQDECASAGASYCRRRGVMKAPPYVVVEA